MSTITTKDGTRIFYKDWGPKTAKPIVFHHGWPLSADDWDNQMLFFLEHGYRVIAHDRRGHGRSTQTWEGNEMDTYAADVAALTDHLGLPNAVHVGHSTGGGEVARAEAPRPLVVGDAHLARLAAKAHAGGEDHAALYEGRAGAQPDHGRARQAVALSRQGHLGLVGECALRTNRWRGTGFADGMDTAEQADLAD